jgi:hypothetical protein
LVVPITSTPSARFSPSSRASSWVTERASEWLVAVRRTGAMASSSSMKMIAGGLRLASAKIFRRLASVSSE